MGVGETLSRVARGAQMVISRASVREFDDQHLMQQVKKADVHHSETPEDFEHWQPGPITGVHLKQADDQQSQGQQQQQGGSGGGGSTGNWNHSQPKGKSAEALMLYLGGTRAHPVALVDDRRVRPYAMKEGESAMYALSGTGQMVFHNDKGSYLIAVNNPAEQAQSQDDVERFASLRHVDKKKQSRTIQGSGDGQGGGQSQQQQDPKHEGETVNLEVRTTKERIEFRAGDTVVGYYDKGSSKWVFVGEVHLGSEDADHPVYGKNNGVGMVSKDSGTGAVLIKAPNPGPPTSLDLQP